MSGPTIEVFATDASVRDEWKLPFTRIGTRKCNSILHCSSDPHGLESLELPISEANALWHVREHLAELGDPDYVGMCQPRRFFTTAKHQVSRCISMKQVVPPRKMILNPEKQLKILLENDLDGIAPFPFPENFHTHTPNQTSTFVWEDAYLQGLDDEIGLSLEEWQEAFMLLQEECPENLKKFMAKAFKAKTVFFGTIFTLKKDLFLEFSGVLLRAFLRMVQQLGWRCRLPVLNYRFGGYLLERMASCLIWTYKLSGKRIQHMPLVVCDSENNPPRKLMTEESGLSCRVCGIQRLLDQLSKKKGESIKVFACDHRKNVTWELPFIRLGNFQSDAELKIDNDLQLQLMLSEGAHILWIRDHYAELEDPDYVGFCHYRRFFSAHNTLEWLDFDKTRLERILSPAQQLDLINTKHFDGIAVGPQFESFLLDMMAKKTVDVRKLKFNSIDEYFYLQFKDQGLDFSKDEISEAVHILYDCCPDWLKSHFLKAISGILLHFLNMFTLRRDLFFILADTLKAAVDKLIQKLGDQRCKSLHCRELGYIVERYTSIMLETFSLAGANIFSAPVVQFKFEEAAKDSSPSSISSLEKKTVGEALKEIQEEKDLKNA